MTMGANKVIPFSSFQRYQRADSAWANECVTHLEDYAIGFESERAKILPPYIRYDVTTDSFEQTGDNTCPGDYRVGIGPALNAEAVLTPRQKVGVERLLAALIPVGLARCPHERLLRRAHRGVPGLQIRFRSSLGPRACRCCVRLLLLLSQACPLKGLRSCVVHRPSPTASDRATRLAQPD